MCLSFQFVADPPATHGGLPWEFEEVFAGVGYLEIGSCAGRFITAVITSLNCFFPCSTKMAGASTISSTLIILITCSLVCWSEAQKQVSFLTMYFVMIKVIQSWMCMIFCFVFLQAYVVYMGASVGMAKGYLRSSHLQMLLSAVGR